LNAFFSLGGSRNFQVQTIWFCNWYGTCLAGLPSMRRTSSTPMPGCTRRKFSGVSTWRSALILPSGPMVIM